jgi:PAS domain S-box-containing protein
MSDLTEELRHELEAAYKKVEQAHQEWMAALDVMKDPLFLHDKNFRILRCNRAYQQCAGMPFHEIIGQPYYAVFPKTGAPLPYCLRAMEKVGEEAEEEVAVGEVIYRSRALFVRDEQGAYLYSVHILEDITGRRAMEASLKDANALLNSVIENVPVRIFWKDHELRYLGCNTAFARDAGFEKPDDLLGKDDYQMGWREQADLYRADDRKVIDSDIPKLGFEEPQTTPDGRIIWLRTSKVPMHDAAGKVHAVLGIYEDITEYKHTQLHLEESEEKFRSMSASAQDAIIMIDDAGKVTFWNGAAAKIFGHHEHEMLGKDLHLLLTPQRFRADAMVALGRFRETGEGNVIGKTIELMALHRDGHEFPIELSLSAVQAGGKWQAIGILRDITERKRYEIAMLRANRALRTLSAVNGALIHASDEFQLLREMCRVAVEEGGYRMVWVGYAENNAEMTIRPVAQHGFEQGYLEAVRITWADNERGRGPSGRAVRSRSTQIARNILTDPAMAPWREAAEQRGYAASIALPLLDNGHCFGVLNIYDEHADAFDEDEVKLLEEMAEDLAFGILMQRVQVAHREHAQRLQQSMLQTVEAIASIVEVRDPYTSGHQARVAALAKTIAARMGMNEDEQLAIHLAGLVHDLGKIRVPAEILSKPGRLEEIEYSLIKLHPQVGYDILKGVDFPWPIAQMVLQHHERMDGSGYPQGLKGEEILPGARILSVADVVEAMYSHRPYRAGLGLEAALEEITRGRGTWYDPLVVDACLTLFREQGYRFK